jgi:hypothetical protein
MASAAPAGTAVTSPDAPFSAEVARYLADCAEHARVLSPTYHPTEEGARKLIWHHGPAQAAQVSAAYRAAVAASPPAARRRRLTVVPPLPSGRLAGAPVTAPGGRSQLRAEAGR